jgi:hypothetical protein
MYFYNFRDNLPSCGQKIIVIDGKVNMFTAIYRNDIDDWDGSQYPRINDIELSEYQLDRYYWIDYNSFWWYIDGGVQSK